MIPKHIPPTYSKNWEAMVKFRLQKGFGVEDIALQMNADVALIRLQVRAMRVLGELAKMWPAK